MESTGEKLKILRNKFGLTQGAIAKAIGVERSTYTYYELGRTFPDWKNIKKLARIFNVHYFDLLEDNGKYIVKDCQKRFPKMNIGDLSGRETDLILLLRTLPHNEQMNFIDLIEKQIKKL